MARIAESQLVRSVCEWLAHAGYVVRIEVPNMCQSADVVATRGRWVLVVEAKVGKWRRAMDQCLAHEQVADHIAVAIALESLPDTLLDSARERGYGIIHYRPSTARCKWVVRPVVNPHIWRPQRKVFSQKLAGISSAH